MAITTEKELGEALKGNQDTIEVEGDLVKKIFKIRATGKVVWGIALGGVAIAITAIVCTPATGGASGAAALVATPAAIAAWGVPTTVSVISIAVAAGGVGALSKLRRYKLEKHSDTAITLKRS